MTLERTGGGPAGVGDEDVDAAEMRDDIGDDATDLIFDGEVGGQGNDVSAAGAQLGECALESFPTARANREARALGGQLIGNGAAEPLARCGDQRDFALESEIHVSAGGSRRFLRASPRVAG